MVQRFAAGRLGNSFTLLCLLFLCYGIGDQAYVQKISLRILKTPHIYFRVQCRDRSLFTTCFTRDQ